MCHFRYSFVIIGVSLGLSWLSQGLGCRMAALKRALRRAKIEKGFSAPRRDSF